VVADNTLYFAASFALFGLVLLQWVALYWPRRVTSRLLTGTQLLFLGIQGIALISSIAQWGPLGMAHPWPSTMLVVEGALLLALLIEKPSQSTGVGAVVASLVFVVHSYALLLGVPPTETLEISPFARSIWYATHVMTALAASSAYLCAGGGAIAYGLSGLFRRSRSETEKLSPPACLSFTRRALALAFPSLSASAATHALWTQLGWGSYWTWRPEQLWVLFLWLTLAITLHVGVTRPRLQWTTPLLSILGCLLSILGLPLLGSVLTATW
jgi:ABC-type transport system involved in cytochrome c biogenesis permease subunit